MNVVSFLPATPLKDMTFYFQLLAVSSGCFEFRHTSRSFKGYKSYMLSNNTFTYPTLRGSMLRAKSECFRGTFVAQYGKAEVTFLYGDPVYIVGYILSRQPSLNSSLELKRGKI